MPQPYVAMPPFASKEEYLVTEALRSQMAPENVLRGMTRRPLFLQVEKRPALGILDVLDIERQQPYNTNYTGGAWDINASARNTGSAGFL